MRISSAAESKIRMRRGRRKFPGARHAAARNTDWQVLSLPFLSILLFAFVANLDNLTVGAAYGIRKIRIGFFSNFVIGLVSVACTVVSMLFGRLIGGFFSAAAANILGSGVLIAMGLWFLASFLKKRLRSAERAEQEEKFLPAELLEKPEEADADRSGDIDLREAALLALALSINNLGLGIGASIAGFNIAETAAATFFTSLLLLWLGCKLGYSLFADFLGRYADLISALVIVALGVAGLFF